MFDFRKIIFLAALFLALFLAACGGQSPNFSSAGGDAENPATPDSGGGGDDGGDPGQTNRPLLRVADSRGFEGSGEHDQRTLVFSVSLSEAASQPVSVDWTAVGDSADSNDFSASAGTLTFAPGELQQQITVLITPECNVEPDEQLRLVLSNPINASLADATAIGTLINDDLAASFPAGTGGLLRAGAAEDLLRIPIGVPLGGYLRPPVGGDFFPAGEAFLDGDAPGFFAALAERFPMGSDHDGVPLAPLPAELRAASSPYATYSPPSRGYFDSLITKALALDNGEKVVVIVKTDLIAMLDELPIEIAARVLERTGVDLGDGLIMTATHTHDGPGALANNSIRYFWLATDSYKPEIKELLVEEITRVVIAALDALVPARFGYEMGQEDRERALNSFRRSRSIYTEARVAEQDELRRRIGVIRVDEVNADGQAVRPLAAIINYAAHGIAFSIDNFLFSGDVLSAAEREFEAGFDEPMVTMFIQSAGGDVSPRADGGPTLVRIERFGKLLAPQVRSIYDGITDFDDRPALRTTTQRVILDLPRLDYSNNEYPYQYGAAQCNNNGMEDCIAAPSPDATDLADNGVGENAAFLPTDTRIAVLRIGSALFLIQPGEPVIEYGLRLIEDSPVEANSTFVFGLAQDHVGYILPNLKDDWLLGGTEGTTTFWGWKQGARLRSATAELTAALTCGVLPADEFEVDYVVDSFVPAEPTSSPQPGRLVIQTADIQRFQTTRFAWEGGDPVIDFPAVVMEIQQTDGSWKTATRSNGKPLTSFYEMHLEYALTNGAHVYTVEFEAPLNWPLGSYRIVSEGMAQQGSAATHYRIESAPFVVSEANNLQLSAVQRVGNSLETTLSYTPMPNNYRVIDPEIQSDRPAPVRMGRVDFTVGGQVLSDEEPDIEDRDGQPVAVYRVTSSSDAGSVAGVDGFGNTSP